MRRAARVDDNHAEIVAAYRRVGASVLDMSGLGDGAPDLAVGWRKLNYFVEIKNRHQPASKRRLSDDQVLFHAGWRGQLVVVETVEQALAVIGVRP